MLGANNTRSIAIVVAIAVVVVVAVVLVVVVVAVLGFRADTLRVSATISVWVS